MASASLSASLFVGGIAVGATGALLLRKPVPAPLPSPVSRQTGDEQGSVRSSSSSIDGSEGDDVHLIAGNPGPLADFLRNTAYVMAYDRARKHPHWTAEHITAATIRAPVDAPRGDRSRSVFKEDERVPLLFRSSNADYFRSGYDRGHMVPAADAKSSQVAMDETFNLTNIAPQVGEGFNRDYWAHTEDFCRRLTQRFADVYVFTVPLYLPRQSEVDGKWRITHEVIGNPPNVHVPTHFAKVIYATGTPSPTSTAALPAPGATASSPGSMLSRVGLPSTGSAYSAIGAFVLPNAIIPNQVPLQSFVVPVDSVERSAGLMLFPPSLKANTKALCDTVDCQVIVRDFSDRNRQQQQARPKVTTAAAAAA